MKSNTINDFVIFPKFLCRQKTKSRMRMRNETPNHLSMKQPGTKRHRSTELQDNRIP